MKRILEYWREAGCVCLVLYISYAVLAWYKTPPESVHDRILITVLVTVAFLCLLSLLRQLWRKKWKYAFAQTTKQLWAKAAKLFGAAFEHIAKKWNLVGSARQNTLLGKTTVQFDFGWPEKTVKRMAKLPKWKQLQDDRERLGFLYRRMITEKIKTGARVYASDTPAEAQARLENSAMENELFDCYTHLRYDERIVPSAQKITHLKDGLDR